MQRLMQSHIPLIEIETNGACSSQCCDEVISEVTSSSSDQSMRTHEPRDQAVPPSQRQPEATHEGQIGGHP